MVVGHILVWFGGIFYDWYGLIQPAYLAFWENCRNAAAMVLLYILDFPVIKNYF